MGKVLIVIAMAFVVFFLGAGIYVLSRGGAVSAQWSNKLMRLRVLAQAVAIALVLLVLYFSGHH